MLPFTVSSARRRPPLPIVPRRLRGPSRPVTMRGKSVWMSPLTVLARTSVDSPAGRSSVIPPLTVRNSSARSEEHTSELQSHSDLVCRLLLEKKKKKKKKRHKKINIRKKIKITHKKIKYDR